MLPLITLFGPTASGKSGLAIALAQKLGGEVINADSRQVYKHMPLITACPTAEEYAAVPHHMFEFLEPTTRLSAGKWAELAEEKIRQVQGRGHVPIVVGGTGFYIKTLLEGMNAVPEVPEEAEAPFRNLPAPELATRLAKADPVLHARLHAKNELANPQRMVRALAVQAHTGTPLSTWQSQPGRPPLSIPTLKLALNPPKNVLESRITARWHSMVQTGLMDEMQTLKNMELPASSPGLQGLAIQGFWQALQGSQTVEDAVHEGIQSHLRYAKRQRTWLTTQYHPHVTLAEANVIPVLKALEALCAHG